MNDETIQVGDRARYTDDFGGLRVFEVRITREGEKDGERILHYEGDGRRGWGWLDQFQRLPTGR